VWENLKEENARHNTKINKKQEKPTSKHCEWPAVTLRISEKKISKKKSVLIATEQKKETRNIRLENAELVQRKSKYYTWRIRTTF
jgi:hypothetical protein